MNLWLRVPWFLPPEVLPLFKNQYSTLDKLCDAIKKEYDMISEILDLAKAAKCNINYPFQGCTIGPFHVLSPSVLDYLYLLPQFDKTPAPNQDLIESVGMWLGKQPSYVLRMLERIVAKAQKWVEERWEFERLKDGGVTSASNESSVILYGSFDNNHRVLLTGDAGVRALTSAAN